MYKTRNTGMGNGMPRTRGMGVMLYSGECPQTFREKSPSILGNVADVRLDFKCASDWRLVIFPMSNNNNNNKNNKIFI